MYKGDVIQFNEKHQWNGALGIIDEVDDTTCLIKMTTPSGAEMRTFYIRVSYDKIEYIGAAYTQE